MFNPVIMVFALSVGLLIIGHKFDETIINVCGFLELLLSIVLFIDIFFKNYVVLPKNDPPMSPVVPMDYADSCEVIPLESFLTRKVS